MARIKEKISWVLSDDINIDPTQDVDVLKVVGPLWGSWQTWRSCQTDNVICHDQIKAADFIQRNFQSKCNLYISDSTHSSLDRPEGVQVYAGEFVHDVIRQDEIVAMHLAATTSDIVVLLGWDLTEIEPGSDRFQNHQIRHHRNLTKQAFITYDHIQWVVADHPDKLDPDLTKLPNLVVDTLDNILSFF